MSADNEELTSVICAAVAVAAARRHNPGGVFTVADKVFGAPARSDWCMAQEIRSLAGKRPVDLLGSDEGVEQVLNILYRIEYGVFAYLARLASRSRRRQTDCPQGR
ncbi:MAG: hypothetical protein JWR07_97 [Nevskia sp.]|nr:hypothetical protein [Nevskia sp.]